MSESWQHFWAAAVPAIMVLLSWLDSIRRNRESQEDISGRLTKIETKIEPIWRWWNNGGDKR